MIKFFRNIRQNLLNEGKTSKYLKYAIGEIVLVVIGILIALQINNWNEERKAHIRANTNYLNLLTSLQQDSIDAQRALKSNMIGLEALSKIIPLEINETLLGLDQEALNNYLYELTLSSRSFIPNSGIYNLLTSNNGLDIIQSEYLKSLLINLYDNQYTDYKIVDAPIDEKYQHDLGSIIRERIGLVFEYAPEVSIVQPASIERFKMYYHDLSAESRDIYSLLSFNINTLTEIQDSLNEILSLIRNEINN